MDRRVQLMIAKSGKRTVLIVGGISRRNITFWTVIREQVVEKWPVHIVDHVVYFTGHR